MNATSEVELQPGTSPPGWRERARWLVRVVGLAAAAVALLAGSVRRTGPTPAAPSPAPGETRAEATEIGQLLGPWESSRSAAVVPAISPLVAAASAIATRTVEATLVAGLVVGGIALVRRRWFCRWVCPTGLGADVASRAGRKVGCRCPRLPAIGQWIALATLSGACVGYPLLLWLDPLAMFSGLFGLLGPAAGWVAWIGAAGVPIVLLISLLLPGAWCLRICPLGAFQDLLALPAAAIGRGRRASRLAPAEPPLALVPRESGWQLARRVVLGGLAGVAWATLARTVRAGTPRALRPPGAQEKAEFVGLCIRCGNCIRACPAGILAPDLGTQGIAAVLSPVIRFDQDYCREDCTRCGDVCPSGAIQPLKPRDKLRVPIGQPVVDMTICLLGNDHDCAVCSSHCPYEAISLVFSPEDYTLTPKIDLARCPGCGACQVACPTQPLKAIVIRGSRRG